MGVYKDHQRGFTLMEILVVLIVIGIIVALVGVNFARDSKADLTDEAKRMAQLFGAARIEAVTVGRPLAWIAGNTQHGFYRRAPNNKWELAIKDEPFNLRDFVTNVRVAELTINGAPTELNTPLVFSASGLNAPFRLVLAKGEHRAGVRGDAAGNLTTDDGTPPPRQ